MMKSAESSGGLAPATWVMQSGALSMIAGTAHHLLASVEFVGGEPPALLALGPRYARADEGEHDHEADQEGEHLSAHPRAHPRVRDGAVGERCELPWQQDVGRNQRAVGLDDLLGRPGVL